MQDSKDASSLELFPGDAVKSEGAPMQAGLPGSNACRIGPCGTGLDAQERVALWVSSPVDAYELWLDSLTIDVAGNAGYQQKSKRQFVSMFGRFCRWLVLHEVTVAVFDEQHIQQFLRTVDGRGDEPARSTIRRYLTILERVCHHLNEIGVRNDKPTSEDGRPGNPAKALRRYDEFRFVSRERPAFLTYAQSERYIEWVLDRPIKGWVDVRDKAFRLIFLASGPTVEEIRGLKIEDVIEEDGLVVEMRIRPRGVGHAARTVPVAEWAKKPVSEWLALRRGLFSPSDALFLARSKDFHIDEPGCDSIGPTESFTVVQEAMVAIGYVASRQGPMTLRHSFTARQLLAGIPKERIAQWLGLATPEMVSFVEAHLPRRGGVHPA